MVDRTHQWAAHLEHKKMLKIQEYLESRAEEDKELTFKPRLIAEEMLNKKGVAGKDLDIKYQVNIHEHEA